MSAATLPINQAAIAFFCDAGFDIGGARKRSVKLSSGTYVDEVYFGLDVG